MKEEKKEIMAQSPIEKIPMEEGSKAKKVYAVMSGKGGVGKSLVTTMLAVAANCALQKKREKASGETLTERAASGSIAILDGDITGPSIPNAFDLHGMADSDGQLLSPMVTEGGIKVMSINLLLQSETQPVIWRGPVLSSAIRQFWNEVHWGEVDTMFIDCPPGTGDVVLTILQSIPVDGIIIVTTPQDLVSMIVAKAVNMARLMGIPVIAAVENMSWYECPDCHSRHEIFGKSQVEQLAKDYHIPHTARLPIDPSVTALCDSGRAEEIPDSFLEYLSGIIEG